MIIKNNRSTMSDEQVGKLLRLCDELGEYDFGLEFIKEYHTYAEAKDYIDELEERIEKKIQTHE